MVLEFGLLNSGLFPASDAEGEGLNPGTITQILNDVNGMCLMQTGIYTGDGQLSNPITGIGFAPKFVLISRVNAADQTATEVDFCSDQCIPDRSTEILATGASPWARTRANRIISMDADGFTVDDNNVNAHPNAVGVNYQFICFGWRSAT